MLSQKMGGLYLNFHVSGAAVRIYLDGEAYYEDGYTHAEEDSRKISGKVGSNENYVELPQMEADTPIRIELETIKKKNTVVMEAPVVSRNDTIVVRMIQDSLLQFFCCMLIIICGVVLVILYGVSVAFGWGRLHLFLLAFFSGLFLFYCVGRMEIFQALFGNHAFFTSFVVAFALMPPVLTAHAAALVPEKQKKPVRVFLFLNLLVSLSAVLWYALEGEGETFMIWNNARFMLDITCIVQIVFSVLAGRGKDRIPGARTAAVAHVFLLCSRFGDFRYLLLHQCAHLLQLVAVLAENHLV